MFSNLGCVCLPRLNHYIIKSNLSTCRSKRWIKFYPRSPQKSFKSDLEKTRPIGICRETNLSWTKEATCKGAGSSRLPEIKKLLIQTQLPCNQSLAAFVFTHCHKLIRALASTWVFTFQNKWILVVFMLYCTLSTTMVRKEIIILLDNWYWGE